MTVWGVVQELKGWQSVIGTVIGFTGLICGALFNANLNRRRDDRLRDKEALAIALSLYGEINLLRGDAAVLANGIGNWYIRHGSSGHDLPDHFREIFPLREPIIYNALASKIGLLDPKLLLPITKFYSDYLTAIEHFPKLFSSDERKMSYGAEWVFDPAAAAARDVEDAVRHIEQIGGITTPSQTPPLTRADEAAAHYEVINERYE